MMTQAEQLRAHADVCDAWANRVSHVEIQERLRQMADQWRMLAAQIEHLDVAEAERQRAAIGDLWSALSDPG